MPTLFIPIHLRRFTGGAERVEVEGATLRHALAHLAERHPAVMDEIVQGDRIRPGLAAVVDGEQTVEGLRAPLKPASEVHFLRPISGG